MKIVKVSTFTEGIKTNIDLLDRLQTDTKKIESSIEKLVGMEESLKGKGGNAIRSFYNECHLPFLQFLSLFNSNFNSTLTQMKSALDALEPNSDGYIQVSFLEGEVEAGLTEIAKLTESLTDEANVIMGKVSDIISLPLLHDGDVQKGVKSAKKNRDDTVADVNMFDSSQTNALTSVESDLMTLELWLMDIQSLMQENLTDISFPADMWAKYAPTTPLQIVTEHRLSPVGSMLTSGEKKEVGNGYFNLNDLKGMKKMAGTTTAKDRISTVDKPLEELANGNISWQSNDGNHVISTGSSINYQDLGVKTDKIDLYGYDVHYTVRDGNFMVFKDNPNLHYYTQGAEQGQFNYFAGKAAQTTANLIGTGGVFKVLGKIPGANKAADIINKKAPKVGSGAKTIGSYEIQKKIPVWGELIGTSVPAVGSKTVILYISEDGDKWSKRVRFEISPKGEVTPHKWEVN
ncbi:ribonuclease YeeF family protein [Sporosarcina sp.]|uniref:ribonuclease YeeF family protein n=1 Tax=Sporosarcina sp. TaxID=49982 RepID=UPI002604D836|nr:LXG domain-containing protein [Sporosarcina sp.]